MAGGSAGTGTGAPLSPAAAGPRTTSVPSTSEHLSAFVDAAAGDSRAPFQTVVNPVAGSCAPRWARGAIPRRRRRHGPDLQVWPAVARDGAGQGVSRGGQTRGRPAADTALH